MQGFLHAVAHFFGFANGEEAGPYYAFWSGAGSDIGELALVGAALTYIRGRNCHQKGCWRIGKHAHEGGKFVYCAKHHPEIDA